MNNNSPNSNAPLWLKDAGYFNNAYLGDLIVLRNVLYYIPHTNNDGHRNDTRQKIGMVTRHFGLIGLALNLAIVAIISLAKKGNPSALKIAGVMNAAGNPEQLQQKLDEIVAEGKKQSIDIGEYGLIKPLRYEQSDIKNVLIGMNKLKFDSAFDSHDFKISFFKKKSLKDALWMNGFFGEAVKKAMIKST